MKNSNTKNAGSLCVIRKGIKNLMWETIQIVWKSTVKAIFEVSFLFLPIVLYALTMILVGNPDGVSFLPGWSFLSFSLFALIAKDTVNAFRHQDRDRTNRTVSMIIAIGGLGISGVLMTLAIVRSQTDGFLLPTYFEVLVFSSVLFGFVFAIIVKSILIQIDEHDTNHITNA